MTPKRILAMFTTVLITAALALTAGSSLQRDDRGHAAARPLTDLLRSDMARPHEARPHGVPTSYDWATAPRLGRAAPPSGFLAFTAWGQLYRCAGTAFDGDETVELRNLEAWTLDARSHRWTRVQRSSDLGGAAFAEDYAKPPAAARTVSRTATRTKVQMREGYNFHFWPGAGRVSFSARDVADVAVIVRARIAGRGPRQSCLTLSVGGDYWRSLTAPPNGSTNAVDAGIGRFKRVERGWRAFTMTTATGSMLARYPLPRKLAARELR